MRIPIRIKSAPLKVEVEPLRPLLRINHVGTQSVGQSRGRRMTSNSKSNKQTARQARQGGNRYYRVWLLGR